MLVVLVEEALCNGGGLSLRASWCASAPRTLESPWPPSLLSHLRSCSFDNRSFTVSWSQAFPTLGMCLLRFPDSV